MIVRKASIKDAEKIIDFQLKMAFETEQIQLNKEIVNNGVMAVFTDQSKGCYYVAEVRGEVIASLLTTYEWSDWRNGTVLWIQSVYVEKEFRGQGVYRAMYSHIQKITINNHELKGIRLYAETNNKVAHQVYQKMGMSSDHYQLYEWLKNE